MICCFCKNEVEDFGNSTWGCWTAEEERAGYGEKRRCCNACNLKIVIPNRIRRYEESGEQIETSE